MFCTPFKKNLKKYRVMVDRMVFHDYNGIADVQMYANTDSKYVYRKKLSAFKLNYKY